MSFELFTEKKIRRKKMEFVRLEVGSWSGTGSVIPETDPRIRIRIQMKRIRNTGLNVFFGYVNTGKRKKMMKRTFMIILPLDSKFNTIKI